MSGFTRTLFQDSACRDFLGRTSGASGVQCWDTFQKAAHRADAFRYAAMFSLGGIYLDIKILVLQDLQNLLVKKQRELDCMTGGVNTPFFLSAIGRACDHVFQGCLVLPRYHPLIAHCLVDALLTRQDMLQRCYMCFCRFLFKRLKQAAGKDPTPGWQSCGEFGWVFLLQARGGPKG